MECIQGRVAVVTGAGKGIGKACALALARAGAKVVLAARTAADVEAVVAHIIAEGGSALAVPTDVSDEASVEALFATTVKAFGTVDILVNNAGIYHAWGPITDYAVADWDRIMAVNLRGVFLCSRGALRLMKERRSGKIINISSVAGKWAIAGGAAYSTSKFGLDGFHQSAAREAREYGVSVTVINPGVVSTEGQGPDTPEKAGWLRPAEVAEAVLLAACTRPETTIYEVTLFPREQAPW
jgi:NAD(P)-dependent dehydrogenase (short-subunit alcohol dehydrogenase family)